MGQMLRVHLSISMVRIDESNHFLFPQLAIKLLDLKTKIERKRQAKATKITHTHTHTTSFDRWFGKLSNGYNIECLIRSYNKRTQFLVRFLLSQANVLWKRTTLELAFDRIFVFVGVFFLSSFFFLNLTIFQKSL